MSLHKTAKNAATIRVTYPDGCRASWQTRRDAPLAFDALKFAVWLRGIADDIQEAATTAGMCTARGADGGRESPA